MQALIGSERWAAEGPPNELSAYKLLAKMASSLKIFKILQFFKGFG